MCFILPISSGNELHRVITVTGPPHLKRYNPRSSCPLTCLLPCPLLTLSLVLGLAHHLLGTLQSGVATGCLLGERVRVETHAGRDMQLRAKA